MERDSSENTQRFVLFPIKHNEVWEMYKTRLASFWTVEDIDLSKDISDWETKLTNNDKHIISKILAVFSFSNGVVNPNLLLQFMKEIQIPEVRSFYGYQIATEKRHFLC